MSINNSKLLYGPLTKIINATIKETLAVKTDDLIKNSIPIPI